MAESCYSEEKDQTVRQRIISYLSPSSYGVVNSSPYSILPRKVCQDGIAEGIGVSRAHATLELSYLREEGIVGEKLAHVQGSRRRRKVYYLKEVVKYGE